MKNSTFKIPATSTFDALSGILLMLTMGGAYVFGMQSMPDLTDGEAVVQWYNARGTLDGEIACSLVTVAFFFTYWFLGVATTWQKQAERASAKSSGQLSLISFFGGVAFTTIFACALAFVLAPAMLINKGLGTDTIYLMHTASLLTGVTSATAGPAFFVPMALVAYRTGFLPRWLCHFTALCAVGSVVPIFGAFTLEGPFNVGNGWIGIHAVAASWVGWSGVTSLWMLTQIKKTASAQSVRLGAA